MAHPTSYHFIGDDVLKAQVPASPPQQQVPPRGYEHHKVLPYDLHDERWPGFAGIELRPLIAPHRDPGHRHLEEEEKTDHHVAYQHRHQVGVEVPVREEKLVAHVPDAAPDRDVRRHNHKLSE